MSRRNGGVFRSLVGGHSDRPAPEALRANAPISVSATAPPMTPAVRGLRFPRRHSSSPYRCACRSASFAAHSARRSAPCTFGRAARSASCIARSASCTGAGWRRLLIGGGVPGSGIPDNGWLIFLRPRKNSGFSSLAGGRNGARIVKSEPGGTAAASLATNALIPNHMQPRDRNCICPLSSRDGKTRDRVGQCARGIGRLVIIFGVFGKELPTRG
jgi:hypothetical protein